MASTSPTARGRFAGGDPAYLRDVQYRDPSRLTVRATLHQRYGTAPEPWFPWVASQVGWPSSGDVLGVGCGPGWLWVEAHDAVPAELRLTLTDLSLGMVTTARERVLASSTVHLVAAGSANVQALPFTDAAFDVAIANHMLYHAPDPAVAVRELARVLRPGGVLVAATSGSRHLRELWEVQAEVLGGRTSSETIEVFGRMSGEALLRTCFADVEWREYPDELRCTDIDDVVAFITSTPPAEDASPAQRAALRAAVARRFDASGGVFTVSKESGVLLARRPS